MSNMKHLFKQMVFLTILLTFPLTGIHAQITIHMKNKPASEVVKQIEKVSKYRFFYKKGLPGMNTPITVEADDQDIETVMGQVVKQISVSYTIKGENQIVLSESGLSDTNVDKKKSIKGTVTDTNGEPVIGANIIIKGSSKGTITDVDGKFTLEVPDNTVLLVSYIGYEPQELEIGNKTVLNIRLQEDMQNLDEVIVVGYGTQKKVNLTAAVQTVDTHDLENRPVKSLSEMLTASVPGLNVSNASASPTSEPTLNIRGFTGLNKSEQPLVLVDNVPMDIRFVNPNDVESISVLKDAAASAIYGSRAPNGVILITTKSGKEGKLTITYDASLQVAQPIGLHESLNGYDYAIQKNNALYNNFSNPVYTEETLEKLKQFVNGEITNANEILSNGKYAPTYETHGSTDNFALAFRDNVVNSKHNIGISGGTEKLNYYGGVGYLKNDGFYQSDVDWMKRYTTIFKANTQIAKWLNVGTRMNYNRQDSERPRIMNNSEDNGDKGLYQMLGFASTLPAYDDNGSPNEFSILPNIKGDAGTFKTLTNEMLLNFNTEITPLKGMSIKADYSWKRTTVDENQTQLIFECWDADGTPKASRRSPSSEFIYKANSYTEYHSANVTLSYTRQFGKHDLSGLIGYNEELNKYRFFSAKSSGVISHSNLSISTTEGNPVIATDNLYTWVTQGYFGRFNYNYDNRYLLEFSGRYDASSKYSPDTRWSFFPSVSAGYNISQEKFWILGKYIERLKLKASFGKLGNNSGDNYTYIPTLGINSNLPVIIGTERPKYVTIPSILSSDLTWTKPQVIGFGFEAGLFKNRLHIEYDWYQRTVHDQIGPAVQLPEVLGTTPPQQNNSVSETRGWELSVLWKGDMGTLMNSPVHYSVRGGLSDYIGYVVSYEGSNSGLRDQWTAGQRFGELYGLKGIGIGTSAEELSQYPMRRSGWQYQGDYIFADLNGDGLVNQGEGSVWYAEGDRSFLGYTYPRYKYNLNLAIDWKGFSFSVLLDGVGSQKKYVANRMTMGDQNYLSPSYFDLGGYWSLDNPNAFFPRFYAKGTVGSNDLNVVNDRYVFNLSHLRVKNVFLSYSLPQKCLSFLGVSSLAFNFSVENLCLIYNKSWNKSLDPIHIQNGVEAYPPQRIWSFGLKLGI
ncbi:TonB-dependent receptor [Parabacteroides sp. AM58-2XD]|nr:TonB-dependent receptor [Parabacteroides sp. AM58-2XD]